MFRYTSVMSNNSRVLVTGSAGFIGSNLMRSLLDAGIETHGIDNYSSYYNPRMKLMREEILDLRGKTTALDLTDRDELAKFVEAYRPTSVVNLAAQGGVRASRLQPVPYLMDNQVGFLNLLEICREFEVSKFVFASSSSVYGDSLHAPFSEFDKLSAPKSLYALSKLSNEIVARYFDAKDMSIIGLRLFTVYGPWSRPDMAMFRMLASNRLEKAFSLTAEISVKRDFTFVNDVSKTIQEILSMDFNTRNFEIFNICGGKPYSLKELFEILEGFLLKIDYIQLEQDELDVKLTHGSTEKLAQFGLSIPSTTLESGVMHTLEWFRSMPTNEVSEWYEYSTAT
jgi:UDP-glucuronate 4-epimerase